MERRIRLIQGAGDLAVLTRIVMDIIHMPGEIRRIKDRMLPEPSLPRRTAATIARSEARATCDHGPGENRLDAPPTEREIRVALWKREDRMQMIRQDHDGVDRERALL